ncbi:MAG TPA: amidohydrolase family protein [Gemmatimonadaceae bacterium]|nr:amidohydrolase family protein [Gemmatimonadaceae bacterium]
MILLLLASTLAVADSTVYPVLNHDRPAGSMVVARKGDTTTVRFVFTDRNRGIRVFSRYVMRDGRILSIENRPVLPDDRLGEATFRLEIVGDSIRQWSSVRTTTDVIRRDVYYATGFSPFDQAMLARHLLRQPGHTTKLPGNASARLEIVKELTVPTTRGSERVRLVLIDRGFGASPQMIWLDRDDNLFATEVSWFMTVKPGAEPALPALRKAEFAVRDAQAEALNKRLRKPTSGTLAIVNGDVFDSERGVMRPRTTVIVRGDRIVAVGPADSLRAPQGATIIDAAGKTVMPGMWEMHGHMQLTSAATSGPMQLSYGITTVRDLASDVDVAVSERDRAQSGAIAAPHMVLAGFIEGPGKWAGPTAVLVRTEDEARRWVARYDSLGYKQIKVYNLVHPDLIPTIAAEAHARGMRLSGHIPRGLTVPNAIELGFDEVNHAAFLFATFYQDSLYVPTMRAYSAVATAVAPNIDVDGPAMTQLIDVLKRHGTVIDGTFSVWITSAGTGIGQAVGAGVPTDARKADANYSRLIKRLYDAGVTLVAGTDAFGSTSYDTELELYEKAGIPAPVVLQIATIGAARVMKDDKDYGSLASGKVADIIVVNGKPIDRISDVRKVETVIRAGRVYDAQELRTATGLGGR